MDFATAPLKSKADELYANQDYLGAAEEYKKLLENQPANPVLRKQLGLALTLGKKVDEGLEQLKTAAAMQAADPEVRYAYGYGLGMAGKFDEAIEELDVALNLQPNHIPARQGIIYCLLTSGQALAQVNPVLGEQRLDRAFKLDPKNAHVASTLLTHMVRSNQKGKAINFIKDLDAHIKTQTPLKENLETLQTDPEYIATFKQIAMAQKSTAPKPVAPTTGGTLKQVPCPACKQMIMDYAAICPHCNTRLKATGTFAGMDTGPRWEWQEIAFTIMSVLWCLLTGFSTFVAALACMNPKVGWNGIGAFFFVVSLAQFLIGVGLLCRLEWIGFIARIGCYLTLLLSGYRVAFIFTKTAATEGYINLAIVMCAGFMIYLINYVIGD